VTYASSHLFLHTKTTDWWCRRENDHKWQFVAERNLNLAEEEAGVKFQLSMFPDAGKYFKRYDLETRTFVSNIKDQYPDD
jgi:F-box protein 21